MEEKSRRLSTLEIFPALQNKSSLNSTEKLDTKTVIHNENKDGILPLLGKKPTKRKKKKITINEEPTVSVLPVINCHGEDLKSHSETTAKGQHNYAMQCELAFGRIAQNISRAKYSYFKRIPSPPPLRKKEKLYKAFQESLKKKCQNPSGLILRTDEEYEKMKAELEDLQIQFVKRHKIKKKISS